MIAAYWTGGVVSVLLFLYLVAALLKPEMFE